MTRGLALLPAFIGVSILGDASVGKLLVYSQVVLSLQLPFAIIPLTYFNGSKKIMGEWANKTPMKVLGWSICFLITAANIWLLIQFVS